MEPFKSSIVENTFDQCCYLVFKLPVSPETIYPISHHDELPLYRRKERNNISPVLRDKASFEPFNFSVFETICFFRELLLYL